MKHLLTIEHQDLPVLDLIEPIRQRLSTTNNLLLKAPPGAGKSTCVPLALLAERWLEGKRVIMLEPRRLAARSIAVRMASLLGEQAGQQVGYRIRFEHKVSAQTRIEVVTEGVLLRRLQEDPELQGVGLVIFDEFHERHLDSDLALALCLDVQQGLREDLRLLVMSATLDTQGLESLMQAESLESEGRSYPVELHHLPQWQELDMAEGVTRAVLLAMEEQNEGDLLVFLPGVAEIRRAERLLRERIDQAARITPLYGDLPFSEQQRAILPDPDGVRKVVLTTAIAESSLTIEGVRIVVDSGYSRVPRFDAHSAFTRLVTQRVTRAGAVQRCGRAGRTAPGHCYRLWGDSVESGLVPHAAAEISSADLAPLALNLALWGVSVPDDLMWLTPPPKGHYHQATSLLHGLEALDSVGRITTHGRAIAALPLHPRLGHMLLHARCEGEGAVALYLAALLTERSPLRRRPGEAGDDLHALLALCCEARTERSLDAGALRNIERARRQFARILALDPKPPASLASAPRVLALAYPDRIARLKATGGSDYQMSNGRAVRLHEASLLRGSQWLVVAELGGDARQGWVRSALSITAAELELALGHQIGWVEQIYWSGDRLVAESQRQLGALVLERRALTQTPLEQIRCALLLRIRQQGLSLLNWSGGAGELRMRVNALHAWLPEQEWPDWSDTALLERLEQWLAPWLDGINRLDQLARLELLPILQAELGWQRQQQLDELAPTHWQVPSGSRIRLEYRDGESPVLAVKLQELFGQAETPRIAQGRIPLTLHLLSPARRPLQVTQDLAGFWANTYAEVKKEGKGRYPKHPWPDDPLAAFATAKTKRAMQRQGRES